jgi:iron(III) transport system ATP-binding protein
MPSQHESDQTPVLLELEGLNKQFQPSDPAAVNAFSMQVKAGDIVALLGPSGCGKTTTLRMIAGFETPDSGTIKLQGRDITQWPAQQRRIGLVFQDYALFPHLSVRDNVQFGLQALPRPERRLQAERWLARVGLLPMADRMPEALSGGQQQRVALARSLAAEPQLILLDEPFSNLDAALRKSTRVEVRALLKEAGTTAIIVTHDQMEALAFADQIGVMQAGQLLQIDAPEVLYHHPKTAFVASFLGLTNVLEVQADGTTAQSLIGPLQLQCSAAGSVKVSIRPEHLELLPADAPHGVAVRVLHREFRGHDTLYRIEVINTQVQLQVIAPFDQTLQADSSAKLMVRQPAVVVL